ncbi:phosphotransferase family protein [Blastococcus sp. TF02A-26]|uniref:phosphotransferase family protein n=1 Tax=Blastococcus sp. TF02A-26 TaxID=2250577 RepID=UPI000DE899C1|nr:phosphotransferase family protein [Blastococcus sp. TF02A-26]RBY86838.1 acyl-CoA dehydrogenase [Blastococcus sp. TF02A-26]
MSAVEEATALDVGRLTAWLDSRGLGTGAPLEHRFLSGGAQNEIFEIRRGDLHAALRMPPVSAPASRDEGIVREWRIIEALDGSAVPHTPAVALCEDPSVLGRPFYLMGFVDGWSPMQLTDKRWPSPFDADADARRGLALELVGGIVSMAALDWRAAGLEGLGRPDGFHERQVDRWTTFLQRVPGARQLPGYEETAAWLRAHGPLDFVPGLMHGDYQFANVMFRDGAPARLAAIIDWEMGTIGDPKLDLALVAGSWPEDPDAGGGYVDTRGMPTRDQLLEHFARESNRQVDDMDYYYVLIKFKHAIVLEQGFQRATPGSPREHFGPIALSMMADAAELAASSDYRG